MSNKEDNISLTQNEDPSILYDNRKPTLLKKYDIPVNYLDFDYIEKCTNGREMEKIYHVLLSGEEGYYPELLKTAEEKLKELKPKSKLLRRAIPVQTKDTLEKDEWNYLTNDIENWVSNISKNDKELYSMKSVRDKSEEIQIRKQPANKTSNLRKTNDQNRIKSTDYESWDKYDPDAEILKQELEDKKIKREIKRASTTDMNKKYKESIQKQNSATNAEAIFQSNKEKDIGNEYFKTGEYENALRHYTKSISLYPTATAYNNRAITHLKLNEYSESLKDTNECLEREPGNIKALMRRAQAFEALDFLHDALKCVEEVITIEPNNCLAQNMANSLRIRCDTKKYKKNRMLIHDIEKSIKETERKEKEFKKSKNNKYVKIKSGDSKNNLTFEKGDQDNTLIVPIPGTSKTQSPWYKVVNINDAEDEWKRINNQPRLLHLPTIYQDNTDDENYEESLSPSENNNSNDEVDQCTEAVKMIKINEITEKKEIPVNTRILRKTKSVTKDLGASGDVHLKRRQSSVSEIPNRVETPYSFLRAWSAINSDSTYKKYADLLDVVDLNRFVNIIGCKLDGDMMSSIVRAMAKHFTVPDKVNKVAEILTDLVRVPRFSISLMFLNRDDCILLQNLVIFLEQHGRYLPQDVKKELNCI